MNKSHVDFVGVVIETTLLPNTGLPIVNTPKGTCL